MRIRTITLRHQGAETFSGRTGTDRSYVFGDVRDANEYSPVETIVASLAACSGMDVIGDPREEAPGHRHATTIEAHAEQRDEYPQILTKVEVVHVVEGPVVLEQAVRRAIELSATKYCPVNAMLSAGATEIHHRYRMHCTGLEEKRAEGLVVVTGPYPAPRRRRLGAGASGAALALPGERHPVGQRQHRDRDPLVGREALVQAPHPERVRRPASSRRPRRRPTARCRRPPARPAGAAARPARGSPGTPTCGRRRTRSRTCPRRRRRSAGRASSRAGASRRSTRSATPASAQ